MMAERLSEIRARIESIHQLHAVIRAVRGIAAARAQQGKAALGGIKAYADVITEAMGVALALLPEERDSRRMHARMSLGLLLVCAEQGFAGAFTDRVFETAGDALQSARTILIVGSRGNLLAEQRGVPVTWTTPMASQIGAVIEVANQVIDELYPRFSAGALNRVDIVFSRPSGARSTVERRSLLPLDLRRFPRLTRNSPPLTNLPPAVLLERLVSEYVFAEVAEALVHSFTSENAARLEAMESARANIDKRTTELVGMERRLRQEQITGELVELVGGTEALRGTPA